MRPYYEKLSDVIINAYKKDFDDCIYIKNNNKINKLSIIYRNYSIIDISDYVIFYVKRNFKSGAFIALKYAIKQRKEYINIAQ